MTVKRQLQRLDVMGMLVMLIFVALVSRLSYLQIAQGKHFEDLANGNRIRLIPIQAPRGIFYDRNGVQLVTNRPGFTVDFMLPSGQPEPQVLEKLSQILGMKKEEILAKLEQRKGSFDPVRIKANVGPEIVAKIEERRNELPGVIIEIQPVRTYNNKTFAAHLFGYVSEINDTELEKRKSDGYKAGDIIGKFGLERVFDKELRGIDGGGQTEVNVSGRPVQVLGKKDPIPGQNLVLTIDYRIQKAAEMAIDETLKYLQTQTEFRNAHAASVVALNPKTGEVLAMVSRPAFDPNLFAGGISEKDWKLINENPFNPMDNKAISGEYPPGSVFKIVTGTAALELKKVTPEEKILDTGRHWLIDKSNAHGEALGWINFNEAFAKSDNVYFYEMGNRLGIDNLEKYARMFGLGAFTGINLLGESDGLVANRRYKEKVYGEQWYLSETFDAAIGQGFNLVTPLQQAQLIAQIASGGLRYRPYLVKQITGPDGKVVKDYAPEQVGKVDISPANLELIRNGLRDVALPGGTAGYLFADFPVQIAGKTGTAENSHGADHGWFVAYAPYEDPTIAVAVIVEQGGYGGSSAGVITKKVLEAAFNLNQDTTNAPKVFKSNKVAI
ncbi:peptidoglycan glycosyltransferase [Anaerosporomusa subterranea]|uniref:Peptidoglycan glycosyltransferase n=1 Tax=Anaerosporomusa subterranea TaxID=1794912 RepID=A0A154BNA3_ANASB|nr:penicillin-binding protein 2 [Anaerosporomusa subterranea]KYZ75402.1 peptidoglycan glycosyltransferase [Anaerosporomusa subterranea]